MTDPDVAGVMNAIAAYSHAVDRSDWSIIDRAYDANTRHVNADGDVVEGRDDFVEYRKRREQYQELNVLHVPFNTMVDVDGDAAYSLTNWLYLHPSKSVVGGWDITLAGLYEDDFHRTDAGWRFATRRIHSFAHVEPNRWRSALH